MRPCHHLNFFWSFNIAPSRCNFDLWNLTPSKVLIEESLAKGNCQVHLFTDDETYLQYYLQKYATAREGGQLTFGPFDPKVHQEQSHEVRRFKRRDAVSNALTEFVVMACCDEFYGTQGSTVQFLIEGLAQRFNSKWKKARIIGAWSNPPIPSKSFQSDAERVLKKSLPHLTDPETMRVSSAQMNVLNFLADHHLEEMYIVIHAALLSAPKKCMSTTELVRDHLLVKCSIAKSNRDKFGQAEKLLGGFHWFKALLKCRLKQFAMVNHAGDPEIILDDSMRVYLDEVDEPEPDQRGSASSSSWNERNKAITEAPWKKQRPF